MNGIDRREFLATVAAGVAAGSVPEVTTSAPKTSSDKQRRSELTDPAFRPLPLAI